VITEPGQDRHFNNERHFPITYRKSQEIIALRAGHEVDVGHFIKLARSLASRLPRHRYVFNLFTNRFDYLLGFCGSVIAGQCTLMPPNKLQSTLDELKQTYPDSYFLESSELSEAVSAAESPTTVGDLAPGDEIPLIPADQLCAIAFTSGSTGMPSPNRKYWETLRTGSFGNVALMLGSAVDRVNIVATVPPQHMWGLETTILFPLFANVTISDRTPFYPLDIAEAVASMPAPRALVSSPVHLKALLDSGVKVCGLDSIFSATAPMSAELAQALEHHFGTSVFEVFGCSESGILAGRHTARESLWQLCDLFELEVREEGVLVKAGHLPEDVKLQDIIEIRGNNRFAWLGRHQDMVNIAGKRGSLADLNRRLLAVPGVVDGVVFKPDGDSERLAALVVAPQLRAKDVLQALKKVVDSVFLPRPVYMVPSLPRQETGKLANAAVHALFEEIAVTKHPGQGAS